MRPHLFIGKVGEAEPHPAIDIEPDPAGRDHPGDGVYRRESSDGNPYPQWPSGMQ
jgi:hypothetical protein